MSIRIGFYDFFAYALPGSIYSLIFLYAINNYFLIPIDYKNLSLVELSIYLGSSYILGFVVDPIVTNTWYSLFLPKNLYQQTLTSFIKRNNIKSNNPNIDWYILLSYIKKNNLDMAKDVEHLNVQQIMLRNISFGFFIIAAILLFEFVYKNYSLIYLFFAIPSLMISIITAKQAVKFKIWFYKALFQAFTGLILKKSQSPFAISDQEKFNEED